MKGRKTVKYSIVTISRQFGAAEEVSARNWQNVWDLPITTRNWSNRYLWRPVLRLIISRKKGNMRKAAAACPICSRQPEPRES